MIFYCVLQIITDRQTDKQACKVIIVFFNELSTEYDKRLMWKIVKDLKGFSKKWKKNDKISLKHNVARSRTSDRVVVARKVDQYWSSKI